MEGRTVCVFAPPSMGFDAPPTPGACASLGLGQGAGVGVGAEGGGQTNEAEQLARQASSPSPPPAAAGVDSADAGGQYVSLAACRRVKVQDLLRFKS